MLATIYDSPIYQAIYALMDSIPFVYVNAIACIVLAVPMYWQAPQLGQPFFL